MPERIHNRTPRLRTGSIQDQDMSAIKEACLILSPAIKKMNEDEFRKTNKAYPRGFIADFSMESVEWMRYLKIIELIRRNLNGTRCSILEIGTGLGVFTLACKLIFPECRIITVDHPHIASEASRFIPPVLSGYGIEFSPCDIASPLPFAQNNFDMVLFLAVIEHLPDSPRPQLAEIRRVIKESGVLILDTPNLGSFERRYNMLFHGKGPYFELDHFFYSEAPFSGHHREYNMKEIVQLLRWSGFEVDSRCYFDCTPRKVSCLKSALAKVFALAFPGLRHELAVTARPA